MFMRAHIYEESLESRDPQREGYGYSGDEIRQARALEGVGSSAGLGVGNM
jgi:hypothetical protein